VQRFEAAVAPPGEVRPGWQVLADLLSLVAPDLPEARPESAAEVFAALAAASPAFAGLTHAALGVQGRPATTAGA
jgi:predicted molibdopterin-dependent oxidoreductase YjgC